MRERYYLSGIDWVMQALDGALRKRTGVGTYSQVILDLAAVPDVSWVREAVRGFVGNFPVLEGECRRAIHGAPYWRFPDTMEETEPLTVCSAVSRDEALDILTRAVNTPFGLQPKSRKNKHAHFYLVMHPAGSFFSLVFDHLILDARGAENLLSLFNDYATRKAPVGFTQAQGHNLSRWKRKFDAGQRVNRFFLEFSRHGRARAFEPPDGNIPAPFKFRHYTFDNAQSASIAARVAEQAGYLMFMPYALRAASRGIHELFRSRDTDESGYIIPVNIDTRPQELALREIFFNHVTFLFFRLTQKDMADAPALMHEIKSQMYAQVKAGLPRAFEEASMLMRIVPLDILNRAIKGFMRKNLPAFAFSYVSGAGLDAAEFLGVPLTAVLHTPRVPLPPGIGIFFTQFRQRLTMTLSYLEGIITENQADLLMERVRSELLGDEFGC